MKITHNQNVLAWLLDNLDVVGSEFHDNAIYEKNLQKRKEMNHRLQKWETAVKQVIRFVWLC